MKSVNFSILLIGIFSLSVHCGSFAVESIEELAKPIDMPAGYVHDSLLTRWKKPVYPGEARTQNLSGKVTIEFEVDPYGRIFSLKIVRSEPAGVFDEAVLDSLKYWSVIPYRASACRRNFPRSRVSIEFKNDNGDLSVTASRPIPVERPAGIPTPPPIARSFSLSKVPDSVATRQAIDLRWKKTEQPKYPAFTPWQIPVNGDVVAELLVNADGKVANIDIVFSSPYPQFGNAVRDAAMDFEMETTAGEKPGVDRIVCVPFSFRPKGKH
ncbi:MAG: TonB family protein [Betaproteobacteria bacterium]